MVKLALARNDKGKSLHKKARFYDSILAFL